METSVSRSQIYHSFRFIRPHCFNTLLFISFQFQNELAQLHSYNYLVFK